MPGLLIPPNGNLTQSNYGGNAPPMLDDSQPQGAPQGGQPGGGGGFDLGASMFPAPGVEGILGPEDIKRLRQMAMMRAGLTLMAGSHGPQGTLNFGRSAAEAMDPTAFRGDIQNAVQMKMMGLQFQGRNAVMKALQQDPDPGQQAQATGGDPMTQRAEWAARMASRLATAGPYALDYANKYAEMAKTFREAARKTSWQETPGMNGQRGKQLFDDQTGEKIGQWVPEPSLLAPDQMVTARRDAYAHYTTRMQPYEDAWGAYSNFNKINGTTKEHDIQRVIQASKVINPGHGLDLNQQIDAQAVAKIPILGPYLVKLMGTSALLPQDREALAQLVEQAAGTNYTMTNNIYNDERVHWPSALGEPAFENPWAAWGKKTKKSSGGYDPHANVSY